MRCFTRRYYYIQKEDYIQKVQHMDLSITKHHYIIITSADTRYWRAAAWDKYRTVTISSYPSGNTIPTIPTIQQGIISMPADPPYRCWTPRYSSQPCSPMRRFVNHYSPRPPMMMTSRPSICCWWIGWIFHQDGWCHRHCCCWSWKSSSAFCCGRRLRWLHQLQPSLQQWRSRAASYGWR